MERSGIDIVSEIAKTIDKPALHAVIGENHVWQHNWPKNSPYTEVAVSLPTTDAYESELRFFDINIRTPNIKDLQIYPAVGEDDTHPDLRTLKKATDVILGLIESVGDLYVQTRIPGVPKRGNDGVWYSNIRVEFTWLDEADTHVATIYEWGSATDGFGGRKPSATQKWQGNAQRIDIVKNPHLTNTFGAYELNMRSSWLVPSDSVTPTKNMTLHTDEGRYTIVGIYPEGEFWRLSTVRKDGPY